MKTYEFAIIASGPDPAAGDFGPRLREAGCDDATVAFRRGVIVVDFAREAASIGEAIVSAVEDVIEAGAVVERIEPDPLVSLSDIAARASLSRAAVSYYGKALRGKHFPAPVARVTSDSPLYQWADVSEWLYLKHKLSREAAIEARAIRAANEALSAEPAEIGERIRLSVAELEGA